MGSLDGRVAIITGAGRGIGREHALFFASEGARVVVNDVGGAMDGTGTDDSAEEVVGEIRSSGGEAIVSRHDVSDWDQGQAMIQQAVDAFGQLDVLVNNAGILHDRRLVNMTEDEWDDVIRVHLKGHFVPTRFAAEYWRGLSKSGVPVDASIINSTSTSGLLGNPGQANYGSAKAGIAALTQIAAMELAKYGVRVNAVGPAARTRLMESTPGLSEVVQAPSDAESFDQWHPGNASPLVAYLASSGCTVTGESFYIQGGKVQRFDPWSLGPFIEKSSRWTVDELAKQIPTLT